MPVPSVMPDLSVAAASNSPAGTDPIGSTLDDYLRAIQAIVRRIQAQGAAMASASTVQIGATTDGGYLHITGTTAITSFGTVAAGIERTVVFDGALTLTHSASLILPSGANITTAAGDVAQFTSEGSGVWRCTGYFPSGGLATQSGSQQNSYASATAGGTADALTATFTPAITALTNGMTLTLRAVSANATSAPTLDVHGLGAKTIYKGNALPLVPGDIAGAGHWIEVRYDTTLGGWVLSNPATGVAVPGARGAYSNLRASATGSGASVFITVDEIIAGNGAGGYAVGRGLSLTLNTAASGANGLDAGSLAASTWYALHVIYNPTTNTWSSLASLSATAPTLPSGYTYSARVGWTRTDATANKYPLGFTQAGRVVRYLVAAGGNVTALPLIDSGSVGSVTTPTFVGKTISSFAPSTAASIAILAGAGPNTGSVLVAPNSGFGGLNSSNPPPFHLNVPGSNGASMGADIVLESSSIYWASQPGDAYLRCSGWEDNL